MSRFSKDRNALGFFLFGLGSQLQLVASLSMSELFCLIMGPIWLAKDFNAMKRHGVQWYFYWAVLVVVGAVISALVYPVSSFFLIRRMAVVVILPCAIVVAHRMLSKSPGGFRWMFVGGAISGVLCTFIFQKSVEMTVAQSVDAADLMSSPIYWIQRLGDILRVPGWGWYLQVPLFVSIGAPLFMVVFSMTQSTSGRSAALSFLGGAVLMLLGRKRVKSMRMVGKYSLVLAMLGVFGLLGINKIYGHLAETGALGEAAMKKYIGQTKGGRDVLHLLIGGRFESFVGFYACLDKPILGHGLEPWDTHGYYEECLAKFGSAEDYAHYLKSRIESAMRNGASREQFIESHSCMGSFWLMYGMFGLLFWVYVLYALFRYFRYDLSMVPQWYNWLACGVPGMIWMIFFSPFSSRTPVAFYIVACLLARAVRKRRFQLPLQMLEEIQKHAK